MSTYHEGDFILSAIVIAVLTMFVFMYEPATIVFSVGIISVLPVTIICCVWKGLIKPKSKIEYLFDLSWIPSPHSFLDRRKMDLWKGESCERFELWMIDTEKAMAKTGLWWNDLSFYDKTKIVPEIMWYLIACLFIITILSPMWIMILIVNIFAFTVAVVLFPFAMFYKFMFVGR